ncbi:hypothetical protein FQA39_LY10087 [Lamprigera yunnana]|nr:hypothetical protein FQA39_LY10087 [Lamprigera yunnana]
MNMIEPLQVLGRGRGRGRALQVVPIQGALMGRPNRPAQKCAGNSSSRSASHINWKGHSGSATNNSNAFTSTSNRTRSSSEHESSIIIDSSSRLIYNFLKPFKSLLALSEGRGEAICEVGIAAINVEKPALIVCQISDTQNYINTLTKINVMNPTEIIVPLTFVETCTSNRLIEKIKDHFKSVKITGVNRSTFDKNVGLQYVKQLCVTNMNSVLLILQHRYYALAAAAALLSYVETKLCVIYAKESIKIEYQESEGCTIIDVATADKLELVASARPAMKKKYSCLFDILNYCYTKIGALMLRAIILQPPCLVADIEARLDCITQLQENGEILTAIQIALQKLNNVDQLLTFATILQAHTHNSSERQLNYLLLLNSVLEQLPYLQDIFKNFEQPFLKDLVHTINDPAFIEVKDVLRTLINTDCRPAKGKYGIIQRCFAIKSGTNELLDLVRKSYCEKLDEMGDYVKELGESHSLALTLNNTRQKGYHIVLTLNARQKKYFKTSNLPEEFIQIDHLTNSLTMKTQMLINLSNRVEDLNSEILKISNIIIRNVLVAIRKYMGIFYTLCDNIARLDMIQSLTQASNNIGYVRPKFSSFLEIVQGKHPLLNFLHVVEPTPNTIYASEEYNMHIITGPNGSGKSIFIRQLVLLQVMAQVGCYVPAETATFRVADRILARIYFDDNMICAASTFVLEMKEIQYFLTVVTKNTLIIIDELCRSTCVTDGTAIAMAICERLLQTQAFTFFTTHFKSMVALYDIYLNVKVWQMESTTEEVGKQIILHYLYKLIPGATSLEHYSFCLAKLCWPEIIIKHAEKVLKKISQSKKSFLIVQRMNPAVRLKYDLESYFKLLKRKGHLTPEVIRQKLKEYNENLVKLDCVDLSHMDLSSTSKMSEIKILSKDNRINNIFDLTVPHKSLNETGNICDYYNTKKINTSYQNLSEDISLIIEEQTDHNLLKIPRNPKSFIGNMQTKQSRNKGFPDDYPLHQNFEAIEDPTNLNPYLFQNENYTSDDNVLEPEIIIEFEDKEEFKKTKNSKITNLFFDNIEKNDPSQSISELNFNLSLQQHVNRASTPMPDLNENLKISKITDTIKWIESCKGDEEVESLWINQSSNANSITQEQSACLNNSVSNASKKIQTKTDTFFCPNMSALQFSTLRKNSNKSSTTSNSIKWMTGNETSKLSAWRNNKEKFDNSKTSLTPLKQNSSFQSYSTTSTVNTNSSRRENILNEFQKMNVSISNEEKSKHFSSTSNCINWIDEKVVAKKSNKSFKTPSSDSNLCVEQISSCNKLDSLFSSDFTDTELSKIATEIENLTSSFEAEDWNAVQNKNEISTSSSLHFGNGGILMEVTAQVHVPNTTHFTNNSYNIQQSGSAESSKEIISEVVDTKIPIMTGIHSEEKSSSSNLHDLILVLSNSIKSGDEKSYFQNSLENQSIITDIAQSPTHQNIVSTQRDNIILEKNTENKLLSKNCEENKNSFTSLEPLGDIELELFSDDDACEEIALQISNNDLGEMHTSSVFHTHTINENLFKKRKSQIDSSANEDSYGDISVLKRAKRAKWNPPYKDLLESGTSSLSTLTEEQTNHFNNIMNRPTSKQIKLLEYIASMQRTNDGFVVVPTKKKTKKVKQIKQFINPSKEFDVTLFSDQNITKFEEYMNNNKKSPFFVSTQMTGFQFTESEVAYKKKGNNSTLNQKVDVTQYTSEDINRKAYKNQEQMKTTHKEKEKTENYEKNSQTNLAHNSFQKREQQIKNHSPGYYTQNKEKIDHLLDKYLNDGFDQCENHTPSSNIPMESFSSSIFSQKTL